MKSRVLKAGVAYCLFNIIIIVFDKYYEMQAILQKKVITSKMMLNDFYSMLVYDRSFYGYVYFFLFGTIITLLVLMYLMPKIEELEMIRYRSFYHYAHSHFKLCVMNAWGSAMIYIVIVTFLMAFVFPVKNLVKFNFIPMTIFEVIAMVLFYMRLSMLYSLFLRLTNRKIIAFGLVLIINGIEFALSTIIPIKYGLYNPLDLIAFNMYSTLYNYSLISGIMAMIRQGCLIGIYFILYRNLLEKKDVLSLENEH